MTDQELADYIELRRGEINEITGKPYGLRAIAEAAGVSYGKVRWIDQRYNPYATREAVEAYDAYMADDTKYDIPNESGMEPVAPPIRPIVSYVWDLETTNLNTFMGQLIAASFLNLADGEISTRNVNSFPGTNVQKEQLLLLWVIDMIEGSDILIGHNTIGFDMGFIRGRLAIHGLSHVQLPKRQHWDTYQIARHGFKGRTQGYSLENLLDFFRCPVVKDKPSKHDWAASIILDEDAIDRITERCEADVLGNAYLWEALRPYHHQWKGR